QPRGGARPVGEAGAGDRPPPAALDEVDLVEAPVVPREENRAAAHAAREQEGWRPVLPHPRLLVLRAPERLGMVLRRAQHLGGVPARELVVAELAGLAV